MAAGISRLPAGRAGTGGSWRACWGRLVAGTAAWLLLVCGSAWSGGEGGLAAPVVQDPATYLVAVDRASAEYAGLVRIWRNRAGPRLGLIAALARYRRRGVARALLGQAFAVLAAGGYERGRRG